MRALPALDAHAHISVDITTPELQRLDAGVLAVTRTLDEYQAASRRNDPLTVWGVGTHPADPNAIATFDQQRFAAAVAGSRFVGEIGLDGRRPSELASQRRVLDAVFEVLQGVPRPSSVHSVRAAADVLDVVRRWRPIGVILHWWRGSAEQTSEALELGCWFSVNGAEAKNPKVLDLVPLDRILTETDFPFTRRSDPAATRPGAVTTIEALLAERWGVAPSSVRESMWRNLGELVDAVDPQVCWPREFEIHFAS